MLWCGSNYTGVEDFENGLCDCEEVILCSVIELFEDCNTVTLQLNLNENTTLLDQLQCNMSPLESQVKTPDFVILNQTDSQVIIEILNDFELGKFKISCALKTPGEFIPPTPIDEWEIVDVHPSEVMVDSKLKIQLTVLEQTGNSPVISCFVNTPDNDIEVLSTSWISSTRIECLRFNPVVPGLFKVSLSSSLTPNIFEKSATVKVISKHPTPQKAEYSLDYKMIFIHFDENIDLRSSCRDAFPRDAEEYFGLKFGCSTRGNILVVKMGSGFQYVDDVIIIRENKICRAGSRGDEFCLPALPAKLPILKPKIVAPNLSVHINSDCDSKTTQKRLSIQIMPSKQSRSTTENKTLQTKSSRKTQRRNLILWRAMRRIQKQFSSRGVALPTNPAEVAPLLENISLLDNLLDPGDYNLDSPASVSVLVQSSPASSSVFAEAVASFCERSVTFFHYKWVVNGKDAFEDGKLLTLKDIPPGKYILKCLIIDNNSSKTLGQGLATTEVLPSEEQIFIVPSEATVGAMDDIFLHAVTDHRGAVFWTCKTVAGTLCTTVNQELLSEIINLNTQNISIPAGTLPFGEYIWTVESARGSNKAKVFIKPGNVTIGVEIQSLYVKPSQEVVLRGSIKEIQRDCHAWWSSVREKGFNYLHLRDVERNEEISPGVEEIPLVISSEEWKRAEPDSSYMFKLQVVCPDGSLDHIKVPIRLSNPPHGSSLKVEPLIGKAMITEFTISGAEADAYVEDYPLVYEWSYVDSCDAEVLIKRGAILSNYTTYLPPGDIKIILRVCSGKNVCSVTSSPLINVIQDFEFPAQNFQNSLSRFQLLTTSGDIVEGFGLAITLLKSLALLAETEIREKSFSVFEEIITLKMKDLNKRVQSDPNAATLSVEFYKRAVGVAKYFRKGSDVLIRLEEFKNRISNRDKKDNRNF